MTSRIVRGISSLTCIALIAPVGMLGCSTDKSRDSGKSHSAGSAGAAQQPGDKTATPVTRPPVEFDGLPLSATSPAVLAMIDESSEHFDLESTTRAHDLAVRATKKEPGSIIAWLHRANAALSPEESALATTKAQALQGEANPVERALLEVRLAREAGDTDRALKAARSLTELAPKSPEAHLVLSRVYTLRGEDEQARGAALAAVALDPQSLSAHALLGESYTFREPRDLEKAAHHFKKTVELRPKIAATFVSLGDVYRAGLDLKAASVEYGNAMTADPKYPVGPIKRGHVNSFLGNYEQARADYDTGIALGNTRFGLSLSNYRAFVSIHEGKPEAAIDELLELLKKARAATLPAGEKNALVTYILENRAIIALHLAESAKPGKARKAAVSKAVAAVEELVTAPENLASDQADEHSKRKVEASAAYWRARAEIARRAFDKALEYAGAHDKLVKPETSPRKLERYNEVLGLIALYQRKYGEAVEHLSRADLQTVVFAKYHLGLALVGAGRADEARKTFREVADWSFNSPDYALLRKLADDRAK